MIAWINFYIWSIENKILDYVDKNLSIIEMDMNNSFRLKNVNDIKQRRKKTVNNVKLNLNKALEILTFIYLFLDIV